MVAGVRHCEWLPTATTKYEYNDPANPGLATPIIPPRGNTTETPDYTYATTYSYYATGSQAGMLQNTTDPLGNTTSYTYDAVGRRLTMVDPNGNASGANPADHTWRYQYDAEDRLLQVQAPAPQAGGDPLVTQSQYDNVGNRTVQIDANGQVTKYLYDIREMLAAVLESPNPWTNPIVTPTLYYTTTYQYDNLGNLSRVTRASGDASFERATDYSYDGLNRLRQEFQYPNWPITTTTLATEYTYDENGNRLTLRDPLGQTTTFGYDALNRPTSVSYSDGATPNVSYGYDANGNRTSMVDGTGATSYSYDELGRVITVTSPGPKTVAYRYDRDGNRTKIFYPDNAAVTYSFDKGSQLASLLDWANRTTSYDYFPDSIVKTITNTNNTVAQFGYDNARRLTQVSNQQGANTISQHTYTLDSVGNRTRADETLAQIGGGTISRTLSYGYDRLYQLTSVTTGTVTTTYTYDPVGNRLSMDRGGPTIYSYDRADRIQQAGPLTYTVNANGNLVARGNDTFAYDQANRLKTATVGWTTSSYVYDGDGKRASKTVDGAATSYAYDTNRSLPVVLDDGTRKYVWGLGLAYAVDSPGSVLVYHRDGLGSVRALSDSTGNVVQTYQTDEYGVPMETQGSSTQPLQYTGEQWDAETGFVYLRARYYDSSVGRFLSQDSSPFFARTPQTINRYIYAVNNPVLFTDPSGKCPTEDDEHPSLDQALLECAMDQFGLKGLAGATGVAVGWPFIPTRAKFGGGTPGTSVASVVLEKLLPQELPFRPPPVPTGIPGIGKGIKWGSRTPVLGRFIGRFVPWAGWGLLLWDAADIGKCTLDATVRD